MLLLGFDRFDPLQPVANGCRKNIENYPRNHEDYILYGEFPTNVFFGPFQDLLEKTRIPYKFKPICFHAIPEKPKFFCVVEPLGDPAFFFGEPARDVPPVFDSLSRLMKDYLREYQAHLIIFYGHEGFDLTQGFFEKLHETLKAEQIDPCQVSVITGNMIEKDHYWEWARSNKIEKTIRVVSFNYFHCLSQRFFETQGFSQPTTWVDHLQSIKSGNKKALCLSLNRMPKPSRVATVAYLLEEGFGDDCLMSLGHPRLFGGNEIGFGTLIQSDSPLFKKLGPHLEKMSKKLPILLDTEELDKNKAHNEPGNQALINWPYEESFLSLINETHVNENVIFFSEKIYKAIAHFHPFILISTPGSVKEFKKLGFKTFSPWIDESYDDISDYSARLEAVMAELKRLKAMSLEDRQSWFLELEPILKHNYNLLRNQGYKKDFVNIIDDIYSKHTGQELQLLKPELLKIEEFSAYLNNYLNENFQVELKGKDFNYGCLWDHDFEGFLPHLKSASEKPGPIVEVGSLFGFNLIKMAQTVGYDKEILSVDNFCWNPVGLSPDQMEDTMRAMIQHFAPDANIKICRMDKNNFYSKFKMTPSLVFIDATHTYEETIKDLQWAKSIGTQTICGDDYHEDYPGLISAIEEFGGAKEKFGSIWILNQ